MFCLRARGTAVSRELAVWFLAPINSLGAGQALPQRHQGRDPGISLDPNYISSEAQCVCLGAQKAFWPTLLFAGFLREGVLTTARHRTEAARLP